MSERVPVAAIAALGVTQNIGYGTLYYSFSILALDMAAHFAWSTEWIFGALSIALLIGGLTAPWLGGLFDRIGPGRVMTVGSAIAAIQVAANLVQYGAAFTLLVRRPPEAKATIRMARSLTSRRLSVAQVASSLASTSPVTASALLRRRVRGTARTASRMADLRAGEAKAPSRPRHLVSVDQFASRRRTVAGACGPTDLRNPWCRRFSSTSSGMP